MAKHFDTQALDRYFAAMADPTRRAVLERLTQGPASVSDLHAPHQMALPSFLRHLRVLEDGGLIVTEKRGRVRMARIEALPVRAAEDWLATLRRQWEDRLDRLDTLAEAFEHDTKGDAQ
ncbi:metalloregulator ArsR/SmtB family transcription factor [Thioclava sp. DLFJ4-1]|uniref:ArsR/SmtB family transcription factor n=1 Tax=Thioclava sp. DLFJ4-1 TaxID=1915313 RepID=UPI000998B435|nr:metalloregulator ArsR/SmtB family transcription factor [Thioclava sp. DLFJ4-1]OOY16557.1 transcriptional regulator [Thioclava sp. DLFJ4-1]